MKKQLPFHLKAPVIYVNPAVNSDPGIVETVSRMGGLGVVDHVTAGPADFRVSPGIPHGVRISLKDAPGLDPTGDVKIALIPLEEADDVASLDHGELSRAPVPIIVEAGSKAQGRAAENAGAAGLIARGCEGPGRVSETTGLVLLQELPAVCDIPVFLQGGVGLRTAAGAMSAGAAGVVLDVHLLLAADSALEPDLKQFLVGLGLPATVTLADGERTPFRVYSRIGTRIVRELRKEEDSLAADDVPSYREKIASLMANRPEGSPDSDEFLLPLSEDIATAKILAREYGTAEAITAAFGRRMSETNAEWPFHVDCGVCRDHGTPFPIVQGPMAHVSDNPDFLAAVGQGGALPFLAMGNMPAPIARDSIKLAREKTAGRFGVGLIGLEVNRECYEAHLEIMKENPPPFAVLAAGSVDLAKRIEESGTVCYLHCPAPGILTDGLEAGLRHFVFEGSEAGGHIGILGSLDLWNANLNELDAASRSGLPLNEVTVLLAGGIATHRAAAFLAGMVGDLSAKGLNVGLQMGTAYLSTSEAVSTHAVTSTYRNLAVESDSTIVIGRTVNTRARAAATPMASSLMEREMERVRDAVPLRERKRLYEEDNLGALRLASKGCAIDPETAGGDCPEFRDLPSEEQLSQGLYLMGEVVSLLDAETTVEKLHAEIVHGGRRLFDSRMTPVTEDATPLKEESEPECDLEVVHDKEPIAVVGIGLRLPGSDSPGAFWERIMNGDSGICEVPECRWDNPDFYYDPDPKKPDKTYSRIGGFVTDFEFDPLKYRIPPAVARKMDRTQQLAVTCVADALEDAGIAHEDLRERKVGIIIGNSMGGETTERYAARVCLPRTLSVLDESFRTLGVDEETRRTLEDEFSSRYLEDLPDITEDSLPGELANVISGRVANVFNLAGPNFTVDAACASSMAAVMNAVAALREGTIDYAVTGGVDAAMHPSSFVKFCKIGALSPDGSRPFDESSNGFVMGEGVGILILKRLSDAMRDGDRIYGTVVAVGSSSDGRGKGITAPNAVGQERAIRACLESAGIPLESMGLIEAHGTSTPVGDTTELTVLDKAFRESGLEPGSVGVGSVKSQIGHLKAAAGAAGIIKAVLSLYHRTLPPTINVKTPNKCIDWESSPVFLVTEPRKWRPRNDHPRRAGVSAFGFGGTNFHVLVQEHRPGLRVVTGRKASEAVVPFMPPDWPTPPVMNVEGQAWVIGSNDAGELAAGLESLIQKTTPENHSRLAEECRETARERRIRCGFAARNADDAVKKLTLIREGLDDPRKRAFFPAKGIHFLLDPGERARTGVAFLFPGQGSQYPFMLRDLAERFPVVTETLADADEVLTSVGSASVTSVIFPDMSADSSDRSEQADAMKDTQLLQPLILTANAAIFRLLAQFGVHPVACAGHSLGEYAACVAAGVFSFRDGLEAVAVRGREMARVSIDDPGLMMSIPADARVVEEVLNEVDGYVVAANKNSPSQTVISGETPAVRKAAELFKSRGLDAILLPVSAAFHSGVVAPAREPFMKTLRRLTVKQPSVPVISNVTGDFYPVGPAAPDRIRDLLGKQFAAPVEWVKSLRRFHSEGIRIFLECGPKRVMTNLTLDTLPDDVLALPTNHPKKGGVLQFMEALAALAVEGVAVDWRGASAPAKGKTEPAGFEPRALRVVPPRSETPAGVKTDPDPLEALLDEEVREIAAKREFARFLEIQGEPIRDLIKSGYRSFCKNILPMEQTVRQVRSQGMDFQPVVVSGVAAGLPSDVRFPFDPENLDDLIRGRNFIKKVPEDTKHMMLEKNVERLFKGPNGEAELQVVDDVSGVIKLAGSFEEAEIASEYGLDEKLAASMDVTTRLAVAAGMEALREAGIPLVRRTRTTSTGHKLPDSWGLPEPLRQKTGVIFASAFPGLASLVDEVTRETASRYDSGARKRLIQFYTGLVERIRDDGEREGITRWFTTEFNKLNPDGSGEIYTFNRNFLLRVMTIASGQLAQFIKAQGPNTHLDAACASTTQAVLMGRDWIRTGQADRVVVVAADDVAGRTLLPWIGTGFLAMGAATTNGNLSDAALPFDDRRNGLILGSAAVGVVLEKEELVRDRGMEALASVEAGIAANSAFHGTRLDVDHISSVMEEMIAKWEEQSGRARRDLASDLFFMSHETYSPKRGGSAAAEMQALRRTFGDQAPSIPITNTKGFTGHTMGVGVEDLVAIRCLQKGTLPPIANLKQPDPEFADLNLSRGGPCNANHVLRLAAGFGSQIVMTLYKLVSREQNRITDLAAHRNWLQEVTGYKDPLVSVEDRTLRVSDRPQVEAPAVRAASDSVRGSVVQDRPVHGGDQPAGSAADDVRQKILALLSDKTGYPADMLDTELDLEADLGIDTVKQAEFISEVREAFHIPRIEGLKIADFPTIERIIRFVLDHTKQVTASDDATDQDRVTDSQPEIREKILQLLSEKTGYPADMLDVDLDLEADLGIDTVKQAEFITEVRETFQIPRIEGLKIADFPTIKHIIGFVAERSAQSSERSADRESEARSAEPTAAAEQEIRLFEARLVDLPAPERIPTVEVDEALIFGGPQTLAEEVESVLRAGGHETVRRIDAPSLPDNAEGTRIGMINLFPMEKDPSALRKSLELYLAAAGAFEGGPVFLVTAASEDGAYGFETPDEAGYVAGSVAGATKAFSREYPETRVRMLDLHPQLEDKAGAIARSLEEAFPLETAVGKDGNLRAVRMAPSMEKIEGPRVRPEDVVLVSGGARGITAACLRHLAETCPLTLVLLGRTALSTRAEQLASFGSDQWDQEKTRIIDRMKREGNPPTPVKVERELSRLKGEAEVFSTIRDLKTAGSELIYRACDIRDKDGVDKVVREIGELCGRVDLVIHAAGIDESRALGGKSLDRMENVLSVKVDGMRNLLHSLQRHELLPRRVVGFGSVSGRFGNLAQVDYSAANDGLAHLLRWAGRDMDVKTSVIDWAPWSEIGMATVGSVQQTLEAAGIDFITPETGARLFAAELGRSSRACEVMAAGGLGPFESDAFQVPGGMSDGETTLAGQRTRVLRRLPREYLRARIMLDPSHVLLDHHRIDRAAVLPGVGGMEIMRAAASLLDPDSARAGFEDVRFSSPLKIFKDEPFEAEVEIVRVSDPTEAERSYYARIFSWFVDKQGKKVGAPRLHHECRLVIGGEDSAPPEPLDHWDRSVWITEEDLYSVFFHGPGFRFLDQVLIEGSGKGVRFRYQDTQERAAMFADPIPAAVEAVFQAAAAFGVESLGIMTLPTGIGSLRIHSTDSLPRGGEMTMTGESSLEAADGRKVLLFDGTVTDDRGEAILAFKGVRMVELDRNPGFPGRVFEEILDLKEVTDKMEPDPRAFLESALSREETGEYERKTVPKRAREWITGRVALKNSVQRLVAASGEETPERRDIRVGRDDLGKPVVELSRNPGRTIGHASVSHSNGLAIAAASDSGSFQGLGVDMEKTEVRSDSWARDYFTEDEIRAAGSDDGRWLELTRMWCIKEAALKAMGTGLRFDLKEISTSVDGSGRGHVEFRDEAARHAEEAFSGPVEARVEERDGMVIARVVIRK